MAETPPLVVKEEYWHAHLDDPGSSEWEGGAKAAAAGGITTLIDMPLNSDPSTVSPETLKLKSGEPREVLSEKGITGTHSLEDRLKTLIDSKKKFHVILC
ncbi:hypothetical protein HID58_086723 [Brassica napus]|uniref:Uncharacterized protein n=1 Tax=Brassica napus TaxID=3708 RepID=A0ABQ7XT39_BRANA|nr:hypothetical protein HID58_086723 [Brassica napus]